MNSLVAKELGVKIFRSHLQIKFIEGAVQSHVRFHVELMVMSFDTTLQNCIDGKIEQTNHRLLQLSVQARHLKTLVFCVIFLVLSFIWMYYQTIAH